jgi:hypothetical protein
MRLLSAQVGGKIRPPRSLTGFENSPQRTNVANLSELYINSSVQRDYINSVCAACAH